MTLLNTISMKIKELRTTHKLSQEEFGLKIGVTKSGISNFEKGKSKPSIDNLLKIAEVFNVTVDWLLTGDSGRIVGTLQDVEFIELPFVPIRAYATFAENCYQTSFVGLDTTTVMKVEGVDYNKTIVIEISGNSMGGKFTHGTRVMARQVAEGNWEYASGVHAVAVKDMFLIKRITENRLTMEGTLVLSSDNPEHGSIVVKREDLNCMWKVGEIVYSPAE